jgi:hypothetical protein
MTLPDLSDEHTVAVLIELAKQNHSRMLVLVQLQIAILVR